MKTKSVVMLLSLLTLLVCGLLATSVLPWQGEAIAQTPATPEASLAPVEKDMHEFMEYVFQPTYKRLKEAMKSEPQDKKGWLEVKSGSLILAEGGNLIMLRAPEENAKTWNELSVSVRDYGSKMYRAAHDKDFAAATQNYKNMLQQCNKCHQEFADGEHQLTP